MQSSENDYNFLCNGFILFGWVNSVDTLLLGAHWGPPLWVLSSSLDISGPHIWRESDGGQTTVRRPVTYSQDADLYITESAP